mmetsp:Transcript_7843/g.12271  ORF Transcript_7843/g.12271 Transcript_7843/m.12271 type:complete len:414 (+) Transcript_7843:342-1583(+)
MSDALSIILPCLAALQFIAFLLSSLTTISILRYKKTRSEPFNLYLVFLLIPDALANIIFFVAYIFFSENGYLVVPRGGCLLWIWTWFFYYACNLWLNTIVAYEIASLVTRSRRLRRYKPPTLRRVGWQALVVYTFAILWACWFIVELPWSPFAMPDPDFCYGTYKSPGPNGVMSQLASSLIIFISFLLPVVFVVLSWIVIRCQNLLPKSGRTRIIFVYFHRIVIVFVACYLPSAILSILGLALPDSLMADWVWVVIDTLIPVQAIVTFTLVMSKPDVSKALKAMLLCRDYQDDSQSFLSIMSKGFRMRLSTLRASLRASGGTGSSSGNSASYNPSASSHGIADLQLSEWDCEDDFSDDDGNGQDEEKGGTKEEDNNEGGDQKQPEKDDDVMKEEQQEKDDDALKEQPEMTVMQ